MAQNLKNGSYPSNKISPIIKLVSIPYIGNLNITLIDGKKDTFLLNCLFAAFFLVYSKWDKIF